MTPTQLLVMTSFYAAAFLAVAIVTRASRGRALGALIGGVAAGAFFLGAGRLGSATGLWTNWEPPTASLATLLFVATALSLAPTYPITWRVARRFGWPGLAICTMAAGLVGPPRDYVIAATFPSWITFAPGIGPVVGVALIYAGLVAVGHAAMWLVTGPASADDLVQWASTTPPN